MEEDEELEDDEDAVFAKAREFLEIVKGRSNITEEPASLLDDTQSKGNKRKIVHFGACKTKKLKTGKCDNVVLTPSKRKKLERVKAPVTSLKKPVTQNVLLEADKEESVKKMLEHIRRLPAQDKYTPPPVPVVFIASQNVDEDSATPEKSLCSPSVEFCYLTSSHDLSIWKLLKSSPLNCNVFVGHLSYRVDKNLLQTAFKPFVVEQRQDHLKVHLVTDTLSGISKGYGFVQFPYRRAAELAMICMQGFEIFGREMRLAWSQKDIKTSSQPDDSEKSVPTVEKKIGVVISDSCGERTTSRGECEREKKTRWDVQLRERDCTQSMSSPLQRKMLEYSPVSEDDSITANDRGHKNQTAEVKEDWSAASSVRGRDRPMEWLTRQQRAKMIEAVCQNLRKIGVKQHLGVFGTHFEADNSRLFVTFGREVAEEELTREFQQYGDVKIDVKKDNSGLSKGKAIVQYESSTSAENALKQLHGKVVGIKPLTVKIAEPKSRKNQVEERT